MISLAASSSPQSGVLLCSIFVFAFHCYQASTNILLYGQKPQTGLPLGFLNTALIHPSALSLFCTGPPRPAHHPSLLWQNAVVAFRAFMLAVVWGRLKTHCVRRPLSCVAGRNLLGCERRDRNAHMNGVTSARHLLTGGRWEFCSSTVLFSYTCCSGTVRNERGAGAIVVVINNYHPNQLLSSLLLCSSCQNLPKVLKKINKSFYTSVTFQL